MKKQKFILFEVKVSSGMVWCRHVNQIRSRTSDLEEPFGPATQGTTTVRRSTRVRQPPNRLLPGDTF